ncbi:MAG: hypothetical protein ABJL17_04435 [Parvibaculum sp.]|uniref:hypothetical protein n=1 Tax=Parvibaculum sp. TaxID=2024848 RepID=UPI003265D16E
MNKLKVTIQIRGAAEALLLTDSIEVSVSKLTPSEIIKAVASQNPLLERQIIRSDGTPRLSTKILIDGQPPNSLEAEIEKTASVILSPSMPCDG